MNKLYNKSEIGFAIGWIIVYIFGTSVTDSIGAVIGIQKLVTLMFYIELTVLSLLWIKKNGLFEKYGLCKTDIKPSKFLLYIPIPVMISSNLWYGVAINSKAYEIVINILLMLCVGYLEEIIFRGFLFKAMAKDNVKSAIIVSSVTFGIGHIINLFNGSGMSLVANLCQIASAVAFGFLFVVIFYRGKTLLPCIVAHSGINMLGVFVNEGNVTPRNQIIISIVLIILAVGYTLILLKTLPQSEKA